MSKLCCCPEELKKKNLGLSHDDPNKFDRSQWWCPPRHVSTAYMLYRVFLSVFFITGIICAITEYSERKGKWFIFMTNQGVSFLTVHFTLEAVLVCIRWTKERYYTHLVKDLEELPLGYKISWALQNCFFSIAIWISLIYWGVLHKLLIEADYFKNGWMLTINVFLHGMNSIACFVDIFVSHRPWRSLHFIYSIAFGLYYAAFSLIYWAAGGVGVCTENDEGVLECEPGIYPMLDWGNKPGLAVGTIVFGVLVLPLLHQIWFGLHKLRIKIAARGSCCCAESNQDL